MDSDELLDRWLRTAERPMAIHYRWRPIICPSIERQSIAGFAVCRLPLMLTVRHLEKSGRRNDSTTSPLVELGFR